MTKPAATASLGKIRLPPTAGELEAERRKRRAIIRKLPPAVREAFRYADGVVEGKAGPVGKLARLACERHWLDWERQKQRGLFFDAAAADRALRFFPQVLKHSKGEWAGRPLVLEPWQAFRLASVFGWHRSATKLRRFRQAYNAVARKNGKSSEAAGIGLYMLTADKEPGAEVFSYATKGEQAKIVWNAAKAMIRKAPGLKARLKPGVSRIAYVKQESWWDPLSRDKDTMDGLNPHLAIADESHAHKNREAYDVIESHLRAWLLQRFKLKLRDLRFEELLAVAERTQKHPA